MLSSTTWPIAVIYVLVEPVVKQFMIKRKIRKILKSAKIIAKCIDEIEAGNQKKPPL